MSVEEPSASSLHGVRSREEALATTFVMLADTLVDDFDVVELLDSLAHACVEILGATAAGLLLNDQKGNLAVVASSSEESRLLEVCQLQSDEGPCLDCLRSGASVISGDLTQDRDRWPAFVAAALGAGFQSVYAVPMRLRAQTIGGLNLFSSAAGPASDADQRLAQALADVATIGILQQRSAHRSSLLAEQLQAALSSRIMVEQAKGVLAERHGVTMDLAFAALRRHARDHNLKLAEVAQSVVRGNTDPTTIVVKHRA
jgi:GAF domain-containing protein